ncbi:glutamate receptor ionotropic, kainate 2-like [Eupeodes corollae]|uniref:glutamate receptor ionotropic, kainate 2-like n=1 Tax=Eupeodes corollae TaxID=290404 RepID=UPI0024924D71|nr:glutamate receptor ionotropic, kainate 2-like [Eupeodes corollae]
MKHLNVFPILVFNVLSLIQQTLAYEYSYFPPMDSNTIQIGLISDQSAPEMATIFESAIKTANVDLEIPLRALTSEIVYGNSFEAYTTLCGMLARGIGGVFGPSAKNSALHLLNTCDRKEIPYIYSFMNTGPEKPMINLHPQAADIAKVIHDIIDAYTWTSFTFLYESGEYLPILNELMELYKLGGPFITVRRYDLQLNGNYRAVLRRVRKSDDSNVVIVGSTQSLPEVLRQAKQVGIITEDYNYIIGNLDLQTIDLEEFRHSEANITSFRMFSPDQPEIRLLIQELGYPEDDNDRNITCPITMEMALLYDAVQLYAEASKSVQFRTVPLNCTDSSVWDKGATYENYLAMSAREGLTGNIFIEGGIRTDFSFEIVELTSSGIGKVGTWHTENGLTTSRTASSNIVVTTGELSLVNKTFTVLLALNAPHAMLKQSTVKLSGNSRYEGFGVDLIKELAEKLGFNFTFNIHVDDNYGFYDTVTNVSTGMVHEIMEGRADLGVTDLTITSERETGVDFTIPFMNLGISILFQKPRKDPPKLFSFMDPFSKEVWIYLGLAYFGVSLSLFILGRLAPPEWDNPFPCIEDPTELDNQLSLGNSLWFSTGSLLQQGSEIAPKALSTRVLASFFWLFTTIVVAMYTANLAACLTVETPTSLIDSVKDLADRKGGVKYGAKSKGSTRNFFKNSEDPIYIKMNEYMNAHPEELTTTNDEGVNKVLSGHYAYLMESTSIEYNVARICNLTQIGKLLDEKSYGIAMRKNWPYRDKINDALLELQESGSLSRMKNKWWNEVGTGGCTTKQEQSEANKLGMPNLGGVYFVLLVGSLVAVACGILDWLFFVFRKARHYQVPFSEALVEEFKIVVDFSSDTKVVHSTGSIYSRNSSSTIEANDSEESSDN